MKHASNMFETWFKNETCLNIYVCGFTSNTPLHYFRCKMTTAFQAGNGELILTHYWRHMTHYWRYMPHYWRLMTHYWRHMTHYWRHMTHYWRHMTRYGCHMTHNWRHMTHYGRHMTQYWRKMENEWNITLILFTIRTYLWYATAHFITTVKSSCGMNGLNTEPVLV